MPQAEEVINIIDNFFEKVVAPVDNLLRSIIFNYDLPYRQKEFYNVSSYCFINSFTFSLEYETNFERKDLIVEKLKKSEQEKVYRGYQNNYKKFISLSQNKYTSQLLKFIEDFALLILPKKISEDINFSKHINSYEFSIEFKEIIKKHFSEQSAEIISKIKQELILKQDYNNFYEKIEFSKKINIDKKLLLKDANDNLCLLSKNDDCILLTDNKSFIDNNMQHVDIDDIVSYIINTLQNKDNLEKLYIKGNFSNNFIKNITEALKNNLSLKTLYVSDCSLLSVDLENIKKLLNNENLNTIYLNMEFNPEQIASLLSVLNNSNSCNLLQLRSKIVNDSLLENISSFLQNNINITQLYLCCNSGNIYGNYFAKNLELLQANPQIEGLYLSCMDLADIDMLADFIKQGDNSLRKLALEFNPANYSKKDFLQAILNKLEQDLVEYNVEIEHDVFAIELMDYLKQIRGKNQKNCLNHGHKLLSKNIKASCTI